MSILRFGRICFRRFESKALALIGSLDKVATLTVTAFTATQRYALQFGESGAYGELVRRPLPEGLLLVFVPRLAALLTQAQQLNGAELA